jgi:hypothetical protein
MFGQTVPINLMLEEFKMKAKTLLCGVFACAFSMSVFAATGVREVSFKNDVQPVLNDYCVSCHTPGGKGYDTNSLDLRTYQGVMKGTKFGSVIKPHDSFTSILVQAIEGRVHASIKMPYGMSGGLASDKISLIKKWVDQGAKDN